MRVSTVYVGTYNSPSLRYHPDSGKGFVPYKGYGVINMNGLHISPSYSGYMYEAPDPARIWRFSRKQLTTFLKNYLDYSEEGKNVPNYLDRKLYPNMQPDKVSGNLEHFGTVMRFKYKGDKKDLNIEKYYSSIREETQFMCHIDCPSDFESNLLGHYDDEGIMCMAFDLDFDEDGNIKSCEILDDSVEVILLEMILEKVIEEEKGEEARFQNRFEHLKWRSEVYERELKEGCAEEYDDDDFDDFDDDFEPK